jgi:hypothetical protein
MSAMQETHARILQKSSILTSYQMDQVISPEDVIGLLNKERISFVLVGAYGLAGWRKEARGTEDVDVVVAAKQVKKAVRILCVAFPQLEAVELPVVVRLRARTSGDVAIDVMKPVQPPYRDVFKHTQSVHSGGLTYRVPSLEMALVMKFAAMTSLYRADEDKLIDAHDFIRMVKHNAELDREKLAAIASLLYPDGGKDVLVLVRRVLSGEPLHL